MQTPTNKKTRPLIRFLSALVAGSVLLMPVTALAADDPHYGGKVTINVHADAPSFDPLTSTSFAMHSRLGLALSRLVEWSTGPDISYGDFVPKPGLAESWEISEDGLTYTLHLRKDVAWQDIAPVSGRPFVAADVLATFEAIRKDGVQRGLLASVDTISAPDENTVVLTLSQPNVVLLQNLAHQNMWILPQEAFDGSYDRAAQVIGTGPFIMESDEAGVATHYVRNPTYFGRSASGDQLPYLDEVDILPLKDLNARIMAFRSRQIDIWYGPLNLTQMDEMKKALPNLHDVRTTSSTQSEFFFNPNFEPFSDIRVRQAVNLAVDKMMMGKVIRGGGALGGTVGPVLASQTLPDDERIKIYGTYDPEKARALLAEAGYPDGFSFTLTVLNYGEEFVREAEWMQQDLADVGITANIQIVDKTSGRSIASEGGFEGIYMVMSPFADADEYFITHYLPGGNRNYGDLDDPELTAMIKNQETLVDPDERIQAIWEIQRYLAEKVANPMPTWAPELLHPAQARVHNWYPMISQGFPALPEVYVTD